MFKRTRALTLAILLLSVTGAGVLTSCSMFGGPAGKPVEAPLIDGVESWHVIVAGGEPEGVAAALAAARNGMRTLLIEKDGALGGLMTLGMLNFIDMNFGPRHELLTKGIFREFYRANGNGFDIEKTKAWFLKKCSREPNLTVYLDTEIISPVMDGPNITGLVIKREGLEETVRSYAVIDATADADVAAAAGVPCTLGNADYRIEPTSQGCTLIFELSGVDWKAVRNHLTSNDLTDEHTRGRLAFGYKPEAAKYRPVDENTYLRGPNLSRLKNGNVLLNALIIFGEDPLDPVSYQNCTDRGLREIPHVVAFMREEFPGFENAVFAGAAPRLYVRETRHIIGEYRLTVTDVLENRDHWDRIGHASYPVDIHAGAAGDHGNIVGKPDIYSIPFRCLVPLRIDGLLVAGRSASYDSIPHGSARVIPVGMVTGEACGTAAAYAVAHGVTFRQMSADPEAIRELQAMLIKQGAYLTEYTPPDIAVTDHWAYPGVAVMRELGLAVGGYSNDYRLDDPVPHRWALETRFNTLMGLARARTADRGALQIPAWEILFQRDDITVSDIYMTAARGASVKAGLAAGQNGGGSAASKAFADADEALDYLMSLGILEAGILEHFPDTGAPATNGQLFYVFGSLYTYLVT